MKISKQRRKTTEERPAFKIGDPLAIIQIAFQMCVSWIMPERLWPHIARRLAPKLARLKSAQVNRNQMVRRELFDTVLEPTVLDSIEIAFIAHSILGRMQGYREYRPGGWHSNIELVGTEQLDEALAAGRGVLLWIAGFCYSTLVTKKALHQAGYELSHVSQLEHNLSDSKFGVRFLNPIWNTIENRYLAERIVISDYGNTEPVVALIRRRLSENRIVSLSVGDTGRRTTRIDFLGTKLILATGPLHIARQSSAVLLPVFTVRQDDGRFLVRIEAPLIGGATDDGKTPYDVVARDFAARLEAYVVRYPDQWPVYLHQDAHVDDKVALIKSEDSIEHV